MAIRYVCVHVGMLKYNSHTHRVRSTEAKLQKEYEMAWMMMMMLLNKKEVSFSIETKYIEAHDGNKNSHAIV